MTVSLQQPRMAAVPQGFAIGSNGRRTAHPGRRTISGRSLRPVACDGVLVARRAGMGLWLTVRVCVAVALMIVGFGVSVAEMASWAHPDPAVEYVKGDPAWVHVDRALPHN